MKYIAALAVLAVPLALSAAPTPAEAGYRDGVRCHVVKKTVRKYGKKRVRYVKVCRKRHVAKKRHVRRDFRHMKRRYMARQHRRDHDRRH